MLADSRNTGTQHGIFTLITRSNVRPARDGIQDHLQTTTTKASAQKPSRALVTESNNRVIPECPQVDDYINGIPLSCLVKAE